jgi:hypothetical protein
VVAWVVPGGIDGSCQGMDLRSRSGHWVAPGLGVVRRSRFRRRLHAVQCPTALGHWTSLIYLEPRSQPGLFSFGPSGQLGTIRWRRKKFCGAEARKRPRPPSTSCTVAGRLAVRARARPLTEAVNAFYRITRRTLMLPVRGDPADQLQNPPGPKECVRKLR